MKKFILVSMISIAAILTSHQLQAQLKKGTLYVGVQKENISLGFSKLATSIRFGSDLSIGRFVADDLLLGARFGANYMRLGRPDANPYYLGGDIHAGVFIRKYIPLTKSIMVPIEAEAGVSSGMHNISNTTRHTFGAYTGVKGGLAFFLGQHTSLDVMVGYRLSAIASPGSGFHIQGTPTGSIGLSFYLGRTTPKKFQ